MTIGTSLLTGPVGELERIEVSEMNKLQKMNERLNWFELNWLDLNWIEWLSERMSEAVNEPKYIKACMHEWMNAWMNEWGKLWWFMI